MDKSAVSVSLFMQFTSRLAGLYCWLAIATAHAIALALASIALWVSQVSPQAVADAVISLAQSKAVAVWSLVFGGAITGLWIAAMRKCASAMHGWIWKRLTKG